MQKKCTKCLQCSIDELQNSLNWVNNILDPLPVQLELTWISFFSLKAVHAVGPMGPGYPRNPRDSSGAGLHVHWEGADQEKQPCSTAAQPLEGLNRNMLEYVQMSIFYTEIIHIYKNPEYIFLWQ